MHVGKIVSLLTKSLFLLLLFKLGNVFSFYLIWFIQGKRIKREINNKVSSLNLWGHKRGCFHLAWKLKEIAKCQKDSFLLRSIWTDNQWGCWSLRASIQPKKNRQSKLANEAKLAERFHQPWEDIHANYDACK